MKKILVMAAVAVMVLGGCSDKDDADTGAVVEEIMIEEPAARCCHGGCRGGGRGGC